MRTARNPSAQGPADGALRSLIRPSPLLLVSAALAAMPGVTRAGDLLLSGGPLEPSALGRSFVEHSLAGEGAGLELLGVRLRLAASDGAGGSGEGSGEAGGAKPAKEKPGEVDLTPAPPAEKNGSLDFDLLGTPPPPPPSADSRAMRLRRGMLGLHQALGMGLIGMQLATTTVGQLNYSDRFANGPSTGRYQLTHAALAYSTLGLFAVNGLVALLAPSPPGRTYGMDRVMVHRIAMLAAAAGMVAEGFLGIQTRNREGYLNQERLATTHLAIGYATLGAMTVGVGAIVF